MHPWADRGARHVDGRRYGATVGSENGRYDQTDGCLMADGGSCVEVGLFPSFDLVPKSGTRASRESARAHAAELHVEKDEEPRNEERGTYSY